MEYTHLTFEQRYHIQVGLSRHLRKAVIARGIGVDRGTVGREIKRGADPDGCYVAVRADERARARARSSAANHPTKPVEFWQLIAKWIKQEHSPEEAAGRLSQVGIALQVSVPAIYAFVRRDERACGDLYLHLRRAHKRGPWRASGGGMPRDRPSIRHRPKIVSQRQQSGHWEADTMRGKQGQPKCVLAAVERKSRYTRLALLNEPTAEHTASALQHSLARFEVRSITFDNGVEFAQYAKACQALQAKAYFAEPARPQQRGTCENTIGLIRQYLPKHTSLAKLSAEKLQFIQDRLNHRPRKCIGFLTPHELLFKLKPTPVALRT